MQRINSSHLAVGPVVIGLLAGAAAAQMCGQGPAGAAGFGPSVGGSFGVPSKPARMISPGGQGGLPIHRTNSFLPPDAARFNNHRFGGTNRPMVNPLGGTPSGLVRPIAGPGPARADGGTPLGTGGALYRDAAAAGVRGDGGFSHGWNNGGYCAPVGSSFNANYSDDQWKLRLHLGSGLLHGSGYNNGYCYPTNCYPNNCYPNNCVPYNCGTYYPLNWWGNYWYGYGYNDGYSYYPQVTYSGPWYGTDPFLAQQQQASATDTTTQPRELTAIEQAELSWRSGQTSSAIRWFREHLAKEPNDADAMRFLALVLIDDKKIEQAVALMGSAYQMNPKLAGKPLPADLLPDGTVGQRRRLNSISTYANRVKTSSAWLTLAVLMQSEQRDDVAAKMVQRARDAGGSATVLDEMDLSLRN